MRDRANRVYNGVQLDSEEEFFFRCWLDEAIALGYVYDLSETVESFTLSERFAEMVPNPGPRSPDRMKEWFLCHAHEYTPDFKFKLKQDEYGRPLINKLMKRQEHKLFVSHDGFCYVDVKGGYTGRGRGGSSSDITFPLNQKWTYLLHEIYTNKVVVCKNKGLFWETWAPDEVFVTEKGNPSGVYKKHKRRENISPVV
jgi:hypothetical protein